MRRVQKISNTLLGFGLLVLGISILVLPVPGGPLAMGAGLAMLAAEYVWAQRLVLAFKHLGTWLRTRLTVGRLN